MSELPKIMASKIQGLDRSKAQYVYARVAEIGKDPDHTSEYFASDLPPEEVLLDMKVILVATTKAQTWQEAPKPEVTLDPKPLKAWKPRNRKERRLQKAYERKG